MPTFYANLESNPEVMDVLFAIIRETKTPKAISKKLKQNENTIFQKLFFLRKEKAVIKDAWTYSPNWDVLHKFMSKALVSVLDYYIRLSKKQSPDAGRELLRIKQGMGDYFSKDLLLGLLRVYALAFEYGYEKLAMTDILTIFLSQLPRVQESRIKRVDIKLVAVARVMKQIKTKESFLFEKL